MNWKAVLDAALNGQNFGGEIRSPAVEWLGAPTLTSYEEAAITAQWELDPRALNSRGSLFGGYYGVLADGLLALATMTVLRSDEHFVTSDLRISYFKTFSEGAMTMRAEVTNRTRTLVHVEGEFRNASGELLAKAVAVQSLRQIA